jgi:hypothetical protein
MYPEIKNAIHMNDNFYDAYQDDLDRRMTSLRMWETYSPNGLNDVVNKDTVNQDVLQNAIKRAYSKDSSGNKGEGYQLNKLNDIRKKICLFKPSPMITRETWLDACDNATVVTGGGSGSNDKLLSEREKTDFLNLWFPIIETTQPPYYDPPDDDPPDDDPPDDDPPDDDPPDDDPPDDDPPENPEQEGNSTVWIIGGVIFFILIILLVLSSGGGKKSSITKLSKSNLKNFIKN